MNIITQNLKNVKTILFRADSSANIGTGHIMRDLVLAQQFEDVKIIFATQELTGNINHKVTEAGYELALLHSNHFEEFYTLVEKYNADLVVIDHYDIDYEFEKELKTRAKNLTLMVLDDTYEKHYCDILLNHNISADKERYKGLVPEFCELLCGAKYTLIRDEFHKEKKIKREKIYDYLVAMGGADTQNLSLSITKELPESAKIAILTTSANMNLTQLQEYAKTHANIALHINSKEVAKLLHQTKKAIITPSVMVHEVLFLGIDFEAIKTAQNQENIYSYLLKNGYSVFESLEEWRDFLHFKLINFTQLTQQESLMVLKWRNHPKIRAWMYDNVEILPSNHTHFIDSLQNSTQKKYFLVKDKEKYIGVIDFTHIDYEKKECEIGLYANPFEYTKGVGSKLLKLCITYAFKTLKLKKLKLEVFGENEKAINLYKKFNFIQTDTQNKKGKKIICMELHYATILQKEVS